MKTLFFLLLPVFAGAQVPLINPDEIAQQGATSGQVLTWDGSKYAPATPSGGTDANAFHQNGDSFGGTATLGTNDNNDLFFETNGTQRGYVDQGGNFALGYTSGATPTQRLIVNGAVLCANTFGLYNLTAGGSTNETVSMNSGDEVTLKTPTGEAMFFQRGGTTIAQIPASGTEFEVIGDCHADAILLDVASGTDNTEGKIQYHDDITNFEQVSFSNGSVRYPLAAMSSGVIQSLTYTENWAVTTTLDEFFPVTAKYDGMVLRRALVGVGNSYGSGAGNNNLSVKVNGTSVGSVNVNSAPGNLSLATEVFAGDAITFEIVTVKGTTPAQGLTIELIFSR